jgi:hypothetical protein
MTNFSNFVDEVLPRWGFHLCGSDDRVVLLLFVCAEECVAATLCCIFFFGDDENCSKHLDPWAMLTLEV